MPDAYESPNDTAETAVLRNVNDITDMALNAIIGRRQQFKEFLPSHFVTWFWTVHIYSCLKQFKISERESM